MKLPGQDSVLPVEVSGDVVTGVTADQGSSVRSITHVDSVKALKLFPSGQLGDVLHQFGFAATHRTVEHDRHIWSDRIYDLDHVGFARCDADEFRAVDRIHFVVLGWHNILHQMSAINGDSSRSDILIWQLNRRSFQFTQRIFFEKIIQGERVETFLTRQQVSEYFFSFRFTPVRDSSEALDGQPLRVVGKVGRGRQQLMPWPETLEERVAVEEGEAAFQNGLVGRNWKQNKNVLKSLSLRLAWSTVGSRLDEIGDNHLKSNMY